MNDQNDDTQNFALAVVAGIVALVIAGVLALAASTVMGTDTAAAVAPAPAGARPAAAAGDAFGPVERLYFEVGATALPPDASEVLERVADAARANAGSAVLISGFHDATGDAAQNAELAKNRALAVRHALEANGVPLDRLLMDKPAVATGGSDPKEARRVELSVRP